MAEPTSPVRVDAALLRGWPLPEPGDDKEQRGRVIVVGGTAATPGAVLLAGEAALRAGAGKLRVATAAGVAAHVGCALPEARVVGLPETSDGSPDPRGVEKVLDLVGDDDTVLGGPGLTDPANAVAVLDVLLPKLRGTVVLDALASAFVSRDPDRLRSLPAALVITVNPRELGHVLDRDSESIDQAEGTRELARRTGAVVLCGGPDKTVAAGDRLWQVPGGGPGLGASGSGDVQAGIVTGLLARGAEPAQAAVWGAFLHGAAGQRLARDLAPVGFLARELPAQVPRLLADLSEPYDGPCDGIARQRSDK